MAEQLANENEQLRATIARGRKQVANLEEQLAAKTRCIMELERQTSLLRRERGDARMKVVDLQQELDARTRTVSNESQITFLEKLLDAEREARSTCNGKLRSERVHANELANQLVAVEAKICDQAKEIDNIKCNNGRLQRMYDEANLQAQEYQNAFLIQAEQVDAAKDEAAALTYKLAEANVLLLTRERRLSAPEIRRANDHLAKENVSLLDTVSRQQEQLDRALHAKGRLEYENDMLTKDLDDRDTRLGILAKRVRDYHESLGELIDEVQDLERANGALTDQVAELREDVAMSQFDKIKDAPEF